MYASMYSIDQHSTSLTISRFFVTLPASAPVQHKLSGSILAGLKLVRMKPNSSP